MTGELRRLQFLWRCQLAGVCILALSGAAWLVPLAAGWLSRILAFAAITAATLAAIQILSALHLRRLSRILWPGQPQSSPVARFSLGADLTEALPRMMAEALQRAERSRCASREFLSAVSHQLSQPLTALRGTLELALAREQDSASYRRALEGALEQADRVVRLSRALRELAEADQSGDPSRVAPMSTILAEITLDMRPVAEAQSCGLLVSGPPEVFVAANPQRLQQAILYLVGHAIQFAVAGSSIEVRLSASPGTAILEVSNQGDGFRPEELDGLFEPFRHIQAISEEMEADRFRLAVSKKIIEAAGGSVAVESVPARGTRYEITLPRLQK